MNATVKRLVFILPASAFQLYPAVLIPQILFGMILFHVEPYWLGPTLVALCALAFGWLFTVGKFQLRMLLPMTARDLQRASWWTSAGIPLAQLAALTAIPLLISRVGAGLIPPPEAWTAKMVRAFEIEATLVSAWGLIGWGLGRVGRSVGVRTRAQLAMAAMTLLLIAVIRLGEVQDDGWNTLFWISVTAVISSYFVDAPLHLHTKKHLVHQDKSVVFKINQFNFPPLGTNIFKLNGIALSLYYCIISMFSYAIFITLIYKIFVELTHMPRQALILIGLSSGSFQFNAIMNKYFNMNQLNTLPVNKVDIFFSGALMLFYFSIIFAMLEILLNYGLGFKFWSLFFCTAASSSISFAGRRIMTSQNSFDLRSSLNMAVVFSLCLVSILPIERIFHHASWAHPLLIYVCVLAFGLACDWWLLNKRRHGYHTPLTTAQLARMP